MKMRVTKVSHCSFFFNLWILQQDIFLELSPFACLQQKAQAVDLLMVYLMEMYKWLASKSVKIKLKQQNGDL